MRISILITFITIFAYDAASFPNVKREFCDTTAGAPCDYTEEDNCCVDANTISTCIINDNDYSFRGSWEHQTCRMDVKLI